MRSVLGRGSSRRRRLAALTLVAFLALAPSAALAHAPRWAPASRASIHPGVTVYTAGAECTANFVFYDGRSVYIGQAAHCAGTGDSSQTNGCEARSLPTGTLVKVTGARYRGRIVYSSWRVMQRLRERDPNACADNDFALIRLDRRDVARVNPSVPFFGGPTGIASSTGLGQSIYSYGNSDLRQGIAALSPKRGYSLGQGDGGWTHTVYTVTPGIPGDSGSGFLDDRGRAFGVLSTVALAPLPASNGVGDLSRELAYLKRHSKLRITLARGTQPFRP